MFSKLKLWLAIAGGGAVAMLLLLLRAYSTGRKVERAEGIAEAAEVREEFDERVNQAHNAGNAARIGTDPDRLRVDDGYKRKRKAQRPSN